jgi:PadR family transcriptional regulator, regulatory protein AphA
VIRLSNKTRNVLLGLLAERPLSGYEIKRIIDIRFRFFWNESFGQIYPELKAMEEDALIVALESTSPRKTKRFAITEAGRMDLAAWLSTPNEKESVRIELLLKVYFAKYAPSAIIAAHVKSFQESHAFDLAILQAFQNELKSIPDPDGNHGDILSVIQFGIKTNLAYLSWCEETIRHLEEKQ